MNAEREQNDAPAETGDEHVNVAPDEIFAITEYAVQAPTVRPFKPWHLPRKHYVRQEQWGTEVEWLLSKRAQGDRSSLRYLGLPGADLLDIRYFHSRFCSADRTLRFLGFDESVRPGARNRDAANVSLDEVRRLMHVDSRSEVIGDDVRNLADENSIAWDRAKTNGPFDLINLDLCGHIGHDSPQLDNSIYNALHQLCGLQNRRADPWALFITSRIGKQDISADAWQRLLTVLDKNMTQCAGFRAAMEEYFQALDYTGSAQGDDAETFFTAATIGIIKWLLGFASDMRCKFSVASVVGYQVHPFASFVDMLSLALRFEPVPQIGADRARLATALSTFPDECAQAAEIPESVAAMVDVDSLLTSDDQLWDQLVDGTAALLQEARYDPSDYRAWANEQRVARQER